IDIRLPVLDVKNSGRVVERPGQHPCKRQDSHMRRWVGRRAPRIIFLAPLPFPTQKIRPRAAQAGIRYRLMLINCELEPSGGFSHLLMKVDHVLATVPLVAYAAISKCAGILMS